MARVGIIGCGKVARLHAKAMLNLSDAEFLAVWSRSPASAERFASEFCVQPYRSIARMVDDNRLDLVTVCTPHPYHVEPAIEAIQAGANVLVEKPLASSLQDCDAMIEAARRFNRRLGVVSQRRWYLPAQRVKRAIVEGRISDPVLATVELLGWRDRAYYDSDAWRGTWDQEGGGVLVNQAPHQLDLLLWYMGEVEELYGTWSNLSHPYVEVDDTALAILRFKSGALGNIVLSNSQKPGIHGNVHIHGRNGASIGVQTEGGSMFIAGMSEIQEPPVNDFWTVPGEDHKLCNWVKEDSDFFGTIDPTVYYIERQIEEFLVALQEDRPPLVTGEDGRRTVELFTAVYRCRRDKRPIRFPLQPESARDDFDGRFRP